MRFSVLKGSQNYHEVKNDIKIAQHLPKLVKDEIGLYKSGSFGIVGHKTTDEMRVGRVQHAHELVQGPPVHHSHGLESLLPFLGTGRDTVSEQFSHVRHGGLSEEIQNVVIKRISVLGEPVSHIISNNTC